MLHLVLVLCAGYAAVCLVFLVANVLLFPRLSREAPAREDAPLLSFVVPARNEERAIEPALRSLLAQRYPRFEVIVVDDGSTDGTGEVLRRVAGSDPRLTVLSGAEPPDGWLGKPHALHQGAAVARGDLLLFVDADVRYHPDAASQAVGYLTRERADLLAILPALETVGFWEPVLMGNLFCVIFFGPAFLANAERPRWLAAGGGAGNLVRRAAYDAIGGHDRLRASVIDDVRLAVETKQARFRVRAILAVGRVRVRMYHGFREIYDGFTKNTAYALEGLTGFGFLVLSALWTTVSVVPPALLAARLFGAALPARDVALAAAAWGLLAVARAGLAAFVRAPVWTALTQPVMAAVWAGILSRSIYRRLVHRRLTWRGRSFDARRFGF